MSNVSLNGSGLGSALQDLLMADDIQPGDAPSYQLCKSIYLYHPLGAKLAEKPITMAQSQPRDIAIPAGPETAVKEAFERKWSEIGADGVIFQLAALSRVYGLASVAIIVDGQNTDKPIDFAELYKQKFGFNIFDPLNTSGSLVLNQLPNEMDFLKPSGSVTVQGKKYHPSRNCVMMNEQPIYIAYSTSAFGFVGRSVYQRILFPMKSFVQSMQTDDLITLKAGVLIAKLEQPGAIVDNIMGKLFGIKRAIIKEAKNYNVVSIGTEEEIETLNLQNLDGAFGMARKDILENIAAGADDMPAKLLNQETFAEGFGEGSEDARAIAKYIARIREKMEPAYRFFDNLVMHLAWTPEFYATVQNQFPEEYAGVEYTDAFYRWKNSFKAQWPNYLEEPPSEQVQVDDVKLKAVIATVQVLTPLLDPANKTKVIEWACEIFNSQKLLFDATIELDFEALTDFAEEQVANAAAMNEGADGEPKAAHPFAAQDTANINAAVAQFSEAVNKLAGRKRNVVKLVRGAQR